MWEKGTKVPKSQDSFLFSYMDREAGHRNITAPGSHPRLQGHTPAPEQDVRRHPVHEGERLGQQ